jgi:GH43 family beta-xylosidase
MQTWPNPFIEQRADPYILRHEGQYYFIASVPEYDRLESAAQTRWKAYACRRGGGLA